MQVHPGLEAVDPTLAFRHFQLLKLKHDKMLAILAFNCNLRHYNLVVLEFGINTVGPCRFTPG